MKSLKGYRYSVSSWWKRSRDFQRANLWLRGKVQQVRDVMLLRKSVTWRQLWSAPKPWLQREKLPLLSKRYAITLGSRVFHPYMAMGALKQPYAEIGRAKIPMPEIDATWGDDSWLREEDGKLWKDRDEHE